MLPEYTRAYVCLWKKKEKKNPSVLSKQIFLLLYILGFYLLSCFTLSLLQEKNRIIALHLLRFCWKSWKFARLTAHDETRRRPPGIKKLFINPSHSLSLSLSYRGTTTVYLICLVYKLFSGAGEDLRLPYFTLKRDLKTIVIRGVSTLIALWNKTIQSLHLMWNRTKDRSVRARALYQPAKKILIKTLI